MSLLLTYIPEQGVILDGILLKWEARREAIRALLQQQHHEQDIIMDVSESTSGNTTSLIEQRRDVYNQYNKADALFFLNYDSQNQLIEVEVHHGLAIQINHIALSFEKELLPIVEELGQTYRFQQTSVGEYFFPDLKLTLASQQAMGGEGSQLGYFYSAASVIHLLDQ